MTHTTQDQFGDLWQFPLRRGNSKSPTEGACLLDAVSWFEYGHLGGHPSCTCPVQAAYGRVLNDSLPDDRRQELRKYITRLVGTVDPPSEVLRAEYAVKRTIREVLPIALDACGFHDHARHCAELSPNATMKEYQAVIHAADAATMATAYGRAIPTAHVAAANAAAKAAAIYATHVTTVVIVATAHATAHAATMAARAAAHAIGASLFPVACAVYDVALSIFDGMLQIGRQADPILPARVKTANDSFADCAQQVETP